MPSRLILALALLSGCAPEAGNASAKPTSSNLSPPQAPALGLPAREPAATLAVAPAQGGGCAARWDGAVVTPEEIVLRGRAQLEQAIERLGGPANITELNFPLLRVEAPADAAWSCIAPTVFALQRTGYASVALRPSGAPARPDQIAQFVLRPEEADGQPSVIVEIGTDGQVTWNRAAIDRNALGTRAHERAAEPLPPNDFVVIAGPGTRFAALYDILSLVNQAGGEQPTLTGCRGTADRPAPEVNVLTC